MSTGLSINGVVLFVLIGCTVKYGKKKQDFNILDNFRLEFNRTFDSKC